MDGTRFDTFTRSFTITQRRSVVGALLGGSLALLLTHVGEDGAEARRRSKGKTRNKRRCKEECAPCEHCKRGKCKPLPDGAECGNGGVCDGRECVCPQATCGQECIDLLTDANNCGACGLWCPDGQSCVHGACTCDPFNNTCPNEIDGQCTCGAIVADEFTAACVDRNSACDLSLPCDTNDDCPPRSVCLRGCADPPATNPNRCSKPCIAM